ncbi:hypothetical protein EKK58_09255 [Candidatus Dependentiae bacterium]|nr:MAG: hypothetical protein EKK58_09255 [Candidatus Dependentiae bacterium]
MGGIASVFSPAKPKRDVVTPEPLRPAPERSDAETEALAEEQRKRVAGASGGRASTYLTGGGTEAASSAVRFLGGAAKT